MLYKGKLVKFKKIKKKIILKENITIMLSSNTAKSQSPKIPSFFLSNNSQQKVDHIKSSKKLTSSVGGHESTYQFSPNVPNIMQNKSLMELQRRNEERSYKFGERQAPTTIDYDISKKLVTISTENSKLKQENLHLKRELQNMQIQSSQRIRMRHSIQNPSSVMIPKSRSPQRQSGDLRNTIKKQSPSLQKQILQTQQLKLKLQKVSKQCKVYEQIIQKMQFTIKRLTDENKYLSIKYNDRLYEKDTSKKSELEMLKQRVNLVMKEYSQLESKMHSNELEWVIWKEQWITEKNIYLNKIKQLQNKLKERENLQEKKY